jgi:hypothetical protein
LAGTRATLEPELLLEEPEPPEPPPDDEAPELPLDPDDEPPPSVAASDGPELVAPPHAYSAHTSHSQREARMIMAPRKLQ